MALRRRGLDGFTEGEWGLCLLCSVEFFENVSWWITDSVPA